MKIISRNMPITRKRSKCKKPYSAIKAIFHGGHVFVITVSSVMVKNMFMCMIRMKKRRMIV
ncbi:hypothetical protein OXIME_000742 [Oxyplasma meridianum]|uniref:Uncharacterized protein n=1 Tax=Oxyplasma meridianum TaxID=3073602 RepID=A0AAX4NG71_9ARCH